MKLVISLIIALALGCSSASGPHPVSSGGVELIEPPRTMDRSNVPVGVDPDDVVLHVGDSVTGEEIWVVDKGPLSKPKVFRRPRSAKRSPDGAPAAPAPLGASGGLTADVAAPSRAWIWCTALAVAGLAALDRLLRGFFGVNPMAWVCGAVRGLVARLRKRAR